MFRLAVGFVLGYVLGAKAGRERYEQIMRWSSKAADSPAVQGAAGFLRAKVSTLISGLRGSKRRPVTPDAAYLDADPIRVMPPPVTATQYP